MKQKLLLLYIACCFFACKPEPTPDQYNYYYLTAEQLAKTPYFTNPAFDTLTFVSNQNDTVVFAKTRVDSGWYRIIDASPGNNYTVYHYYQQLTAKYQTLKGDESFEVVHSKNTNGGGMNRVNVNFNTLNFYINDYFLGINHRWGIDSLINNNKVFYQITLLNNNGGDSLTGRAYINKDYGVFYMLDLKINKNWNLKINS